MANRKDPAFLLYAGDFMSDPKVQRMTYEQIGIYFWLLMQEWLEGSIPMDEDEIEKGLRFTKEETERWEDNSAIVLPFFPIAMPQRMRLNKRLEKERDERIAYRKKKSDSGKKGAKRRWGKKKRNDSSAIVSPLAKGMAKNGSSSSSSSSSSYEISKDISSPPPEAVDICIRLKKDILELNPKAKLPASWDKGPGKEWVAHADRMLRIDKRELSEVHKVLTWVKGSDFWRGNILSTSKLRKQFDQLHIKMNGRIKKNTVESAFTLDDAKSMGLISEDYVDGSE